MVLSNRLFLKVFTGVWVACAPVSAFAFSLAEVERDVALDYPAVLQLTTEDVAKVQAGNNNVVLFDVREEDEFLVSHLPGSIRVDPDISEADFMKQFAFMAAGKQVLFYCSVGVRSSGVAQRVGKQLKLAGAKRIANMRGGIFRWHNEKRRLMSSAGQTDLVHPYNTSWGRLVERKSRTSYTPIPQN